MAEITSGTVKATPLGDMWIGTLELANTVDDGDNVNLASSNFLGSKVKEIVFAHGIRQKDSTGAGTAEQSPIVTSSGTANMTFSNSGTYVTGVGIAEEGGRNAVSNELRKVFFVALSESL